jgi:hypothetical protein
MLGRPERLFHPSRAVSSDRHEPLRKRPPAILLQPVETLAQRFRDGRRHAFSSQRCKFLRQVVSLGILNI